MPEIKVEISRYIDNSFPGWVECYFIDAWGIKHEFREKIPVVTSKDLDKDSIYPQEGVIACEIVKYWTDTEGRELVTISTYKPWGCETLKGQTSFEVLKE